MHWKPIALLTDLYQQPLMVASPKLIHGDSNPLGISQAYWQDTEGPGQGEFRCADFDMCNDEYCTRSISFEHVTHFLIPTGPYPEGWDGES